MQTENSETLMFQEETDIFNLVVSLQNNKLTITLKDFVSMAIYQKEYTKQNIGWEIHQKMDLFDVYTAFFQTRASQESEITNQKDQKQKKFKFGQIIEHEENPCYRIEEGGKVTVYLGMLDKKTKKEVIYQSNLNLTKVKSLTEKGEEVDLQNDKIFEELSKKIKKQEQEKQELFTRISSLEEENTNLKQHLRTLTEGQNQKNQRFERFQEKIIQINHKNQRLQQRVTQTSEQLERRIILTSDQLYVQKQHSLDKIQQIQKSLQAMRLTLTYLSLPQFYNSYFKVEGLKVQYIKNDKSWTQYMFNQPILHNEPAKFKIKITKTYMRHIMVGVVDHIKQKDQRYSHSSGKAMCYYGYYGSKLPQDAIEGNGFKQDDVVEVDVNRSTNTIKYTVNGALKAQHTNKMLTDNLRVFVPYVELRNCNDVVQWLLD